MDDPVTTDTVARIEIKPEPQKHGYIDFVVHGITAKGVMVVLRELEGIRHDALVPRKIDRLKGFFAAEFVGKEVSFLTKTGVAKDGEPRIYHHICWPHVNQDTRMKYADLKRKLREMDPAAVVTK